MELVTYARASACILISLFIAFGANSQSSKRKVDRRQAAAKPTKETASRSGKPTPSKTARQTPKSADQTGPQPPPEVASTVSTTPEESRPPENVAIVNGQTVTTADLDPRVGEVLDTLDQRIAEARRQIVNLAINTILLDIEAKRRKLTSQQLYDLEVTLKVTNPTEDEVKEFIEANRNEFGTDDPTTLRPEVMAVLKRKQEEKLSDEFANRLRKANRVTMGADINRPNLQPNAVLAIVSGRSVTAGVVLERLKPIIYRLRSTTYQMEKDALDHTINDLLLLAEANRRNIAPEEIVRKEITEKIHHPTDEEVDKFYAENRATVTGELSSVRTQLTEFLENQDRERLEKTLSDKLRKGADIKILIAEPELPVQDISTDDDPARGDANAPVTVVEFSDFECPACAGMHPIIEEVVKSYGNKVRFVMRDYPLPRHTHARKAAEAANAANAQGKFFEYADLLFKHQKELDEASLKKYASELGLDRKKFDAALDSGMYAAEIKHDIDDGDVYGVNSTPAIFVNGVRLMVISADGLRAAIDRVLAGPNAPATKPPN